MDRPKRILNVSKIVNWGSNPSVTISYDIPFLVKRIVIKPLVYNYADAGAPVTIYQHAAIYSDITGGDDVIGCVIYGVYASGFQPLNAFVYDFVNPITVVGLKKFRAVSVQSGDTYSLANGMLISMEFHEA